MNTSIKSCQLGNTKSTTIKDCFANLYSIQKTGHSELHLEKHFFRN